jgi:hypothetical protein
MKIPMAKRVAPAILALGVAVGGLGLSTGTAFASSSSTKSTAVKVGASCSKADKGKTAKAGKTEVVCKDVKGKYKWEKK